MFTSKEIRQKYLDFFAARGHKIIPSASLLPENDSSTLFINSGMQPLLPYFLGAAHPEGQRLVDVQKCFRTGDIEEVGDGRHDTCFEMLGNWSLGDYFKSEQLTWLFEFLTKELGIDPARLFVTTFAGDPKYNLPKDTEAVTLWKNIFEQAGINPDGKIFSYGSEKNWWSRAGVPGNMPLGEPGGPDSEIFYDLGADLQLHENSKFKDQPCHVNCDCGRYVEIGNSVFLTYKKTAEGFIPLAQKNIDFGGGLERITIAAQGKNSVFETDLFSFILDKIAQLSGKNYAAEKLAFEVIADHLKAATFIMGDDRGICPSNVDQGYIVRRLLRRAMRYGRKIGLLDVSWLPEIAQLIIQKYGEIYPELARNAEFVRQHITQEAEKFQRTLEGGLREFYKLAGQNIITGTEAFTLFQSYGFPLEMTQELAAEKNIKVDAEGFKAEFAKHKELSRTATCGKFKGGLADASEATTKLHTAAHLLLAALRKLLGAGIIQKGANITAERLRFDFSYPEKLTETQKKQIEDLVNAQIQKDLAVDCQEMSLADAQASGAMGIFNDKYGAKVKVYTICNFSKEICGGPHVTHTGALGKFKIVKEESVSAGVRRIKATLS